MASKKIKTMKHTHIRNWLLKFAVLGVYSFYVLTSRGQEVEQARAEALKIARKPATPIIIQLPRRVIIIHKRFRIVLPRFPGVPPPHIS